MAKRKYFVLTAHDAEHREVVALRGVILMRRWRSGKWKNKGFVKE